MNMLVKLSGALGGGDELHAAPAALALHKGRSETRRHVPAKPAQKREHLARA